MNPEGVSVREETFSRLYLFQLESMGGILGTHR